jgi:hypothetical protein
LLGPFCSPGRCADSRLSLQFDAALIKSTTLIDVRLAPTSGAKTVIS